jgi:hypothetical protein
MAGVMGLDAWAAGGTRMGHKGVATAFPIGEAALSSHRSSHHFVRSGAWARGLAHCPIKTGAGALVDTISSPLSSPLY